MFASSTVKANVNRFPVKLVLKGGDREDLHLLVPTHKTLRDILYEPATFVEVEDAKGLRSYLAKSEITRLEVVEKVEPARKMDASSFLKEKADASRYDSHDPLTVLGLGKDASDMEIKHAYRELAKTYHSDRWVSDPLPLEMNVLAAWIFQRVTEAYHQLVEAHKKSVTS
jgi:hypothetical protein